MKLVSALAVYSFFDNISNLLPFFIEGNVNSSFIDVFVNVYLNALSEHGGCNESRERDGEHLGAGLFVRLFGRFHRLLR